MLNDFMIKNSKDEHLYKVFSEAFHEVVEPHLEDIKDTLENVETRLDKVETKLDKIDDRLDRHGTILDGYGKRMSTLEEISPIH